MNSRHGWEIYNRWEFNSLSQSGSFSYPRKKRKEWIWYKLPSPAAQLRAAALASSWTKHNFKRQKSSSQLQPLHLLCKEFSRTQIQPSAEATVKSKNCSVWTLHNQNSYGSSLTQLVLFHVFSGWGVLQWSSMCQYGRLYVEKVRNCRQKKLSGGITHSRLPFTN